MNLEKCIVDILIDIAKNNVNIKKIILFGSRAIGTNREASDVDIAIAGDLTHAEICEISGILNDETPTPYYYDVVHLDKVCNDVLRDEIFTKGVCLYSRYSHTSER